MSRAWAVEGIQTKSTKVLACMETLANTHTYTRTVHSGEGKSSFEQLLLPLSLPPSDPPL